ncbi:50S ribosomal protein L18 [Candidatus Neptunochlamydia vexilliferae]|uniref:Large ribosomal subunit protein uL18 n=1 Tax=Candidatus Neptunichlamydia vexilliferae TaxID=1651774 RepID=A0ABS0AZ23_9BACT|nr:50S ribosomal protein L18 [Candidatus Neptunochlamydia vexilliferae]MBF5058867.1 50S ribosomal protein L18 [Candidatus Neptunochlamydia vexilliferae]
MHLNLKKRTTIRKKRALRIRKKLRGTAERPRLSVSKTLTHIGVQLIDDEKGITLASYSTLAKELKGKKKSKETARLVGEKIGELAKGKNIDRVVFDRGRFKYHGIIAELANGAREKGIKF